MGLFRFYGGKKIFSVAASVVARRWSARTAARRVWMDAMDCCEARRWSARSACEAFRARVDGRDGGCACLI